MSTLPSLYNTTDGANWKNNTNWLSDKPLGEWHGVTTDDNGRVSVLMLQANNLKGTLPSELSSLSNLRWLMLPNNGLGGELPAWLASLSNLNTLELEINEFTGEIPEE